MLKKNNLFLLICLCPIITTFLIIVNINVFNPENIFLFTFSIFSIISSLFILYKVFIYNQKRIKN